MITCTHNAPSCFLLDLVLHILLYGEVLSTHIHKFLLSKVYILCRRCKSLSQNDSWVRGNVVLCFVFDYQYEAIQDVAWAVKEAGAVGLISAMNPSTSPDPGDFNFPLVQVSHEVGIQMLYYIRSTR